MQQDARRQYIEGNMHPVDAIVEVRKKIRELKAVEDELRQSIVEGKNFVGDMFVAEVTETTQMRVSQKAIEELIGDVEKVKRPAVISSLKTRAKK